MSDINLGIKLRYDGKDVEGGIVVSREQFRQLAIEARKAGEASAGGFSSAAVGVRSISAALDQARSAALGFMSVTSAFAASRWIVEQASAMQQLDARLRVATASAAEFARAQAGVFEVANRWGASVGETANTFSRLNPVLAQMGGNATTTLRMLDGLSASLRLSGASAAETGSVLLQFSQAMGSGRVGGDEFRAMMEAAEPLMRAVAKELGKTTAELRQMSEEGRLTSSVFGNALLPAIDKLKAQAESIPLGVSQAWQVLRNNLSRSFGEEFSGQATSVAASIQSLAGQTDTLAAALHAAGDAGWEALKVLGVVSGSALAAGMAKTAQAAWAQATALATLQKVRAADAAEQVVATAAEAARLQTMLALIEADNARALAERAAATATLYSTTAIGAQSAALAANADAKRAFAAATRLLLETERSGIATKAALVAAESAHAAALQAAERASVGYAAGHAAGATSARLAGAALTALGGPIGLVTTALTAGVLAWTLWGNKAESESDRAGKAVEEALARAERRAREKRFGAGETGQDREALNAIQVSLSAARLTAKSAIYEHIRVAAEQEVADLEAQERKIRESMAQAGATPAVAADKPLSAAGEYPKLTESLKWREKIQKEHNERLLNMQKAFADKMRETVDPMARAELLTNHLSANAAELRAVKKELEGLPEAVEGKALAAARAETLTAAAKETAQRAGGIYRQELENFRISAAQFAAAMTQIELYALTEERRGVAAEKPTDPAGQLKQAERLKAIDRQIADLPRKQAESIEDAANRARGALADLQAAGGATLTTLEAAQIEFAHKWDTKIALALQGGADPAAVARAAQDAWQTVFAGIEAERQRAMDSLAVAAGKSFDPMTQAGLAFGKEFGAVLRQAAKDGDEAMLELGRKAWANLADQTEFDDAKKQFDSLFEQMKVELDAVRQKAEENGGLFAGIGAAAESEEITQRLVPALRQLQTQMDALKGDNPERAKVAAAAAGAINGATRDADREWRKFTDDIERSLTDALQRGFESGKGFAESFVDSLRNTLKTAALKIMVQAVVDPVMGAARSTLSSGVGGNLLSAGNSALSLVGSGGAAAGTLAAANVAGAAGGDALGTLIAGNAGAWGVEAGAVGSAASAMGAIGAALPWIGGGLAVASALGLFGEDGPAQRSGNFRSGLGLSTGVGPGDSNNAIDSTAWFSGDEMNASLNEFQKEIAAREKRLITNLGLTAAQQNAASAALYGIGDRKYDFGVEHTDWRSSMADEQIAADRLQVISDTLGISIADLTAAMSDSAESVAAKTAKLNALKGADLAKGMEATLRDLDRVGAVQSALASARGSVFGTDTVDAQIAAQRQRLADADTVEQRAGIVDRIRELVLSRYSAERSAIEANRDAAVTAQQALRDALKGVGEYAQGLSLSALSPLTNAQRLEAARGQFGELLGSARSGSAEAVGKLSGSADAYLSSAREFYASSPAYTAIFSAVQSDLSALGLTAGSVGGQQDWQAQLLAVQDKAGAELTDLTTLTNDWTASLESALTQQAADFAALKLSQAAIDENTKNLDVRIGAVVSAAVALSFDKLAAAIAASDVKTARALRDAVAAVTAV